MTKTKSKFKENPFHIVSKEHLVEVKTFLERNFIMTNEQILELADKYFDYQGGWIAYSKEDLLKFAALIYTEGFKVGYDEGWESNNVSTKMNTWSSDDD